MSPKYKNVLESRKSQGHLAKIALNDDKNGEILYSNGTLYTYKKTSYFIGVAKNSLLKS